LAFACCSRSFLERVSYRSNIRRITSTRHVRLSSLVSFPPFLIVPTSSLVSASVPDQPPPDHITFQQPEMDQPSTEQKSNVRGTRRWNILASFKELWRQHRREKPLGKAPGVRQSIITIFKTSCEQHPPAVTLFPPSDLFELGLNVLLIFIPLSVRVFVFAESCV
jgi:hypothetical protein